MILVFIADLVCIGIGVHFLLTHKGPRPRV